MKKSTIWTAVVAGVLVVAVILIIVFVPSNSTNIKPTGSSKPSTVSHTLSTAQKTAAETKINANLQSFFSVNTSMATRETLLENGQQFAQAMTTEFTQLNSQKPSITVSSITFPSTTSATVTYTISLDSQPVLKDQTGTMVLVNGNWLVGDATMCQLLSLGGSAPTVCNNVAK
jgi:hypothetical protein